MTSCLATISSSPPEMGGTVFSSVSLLYLTNKIGQHVCMFSNVLVLLTGIPHDFPQFFRSISHGILFFHGALVRRQLRLGTAADLSRGDMRLPVLLDVGQVGRVLQRDGPLARFVFDLVEPGAHVWRLVRESGKVEHHVPRVDVRVIRVHVGFQLEFVPPMERLEDDGVSEFGSGKGHLGGALVVPAVMDLGPPGP